MTIKRKIFITNTVMILAALLVLLGVGSLLLTIFQHTFLTHQSENAELSAYTAQVQQLLEENRGYDGDWEQWADVLDEYDFRLAVRDQNGETVYSNLNQTETESVDAIGEQGDDNTGSGHHGHGHVSGITVSTFFINSVTVLSAKLPAGDNVYQFYAASGAASESLFSTDKRVFQLFLLLFVVIGAIAIVAILLGSRMFTKKLVRQIMEPVDQLAAVAERIEGGDLTQPVIYRRDDEFRNVCDSFNHMQAHLREGMERNAAYEKARTEMISGISHDLRTPLTSVKGYIKGLQDGVANTEEKRQQYLDIAYDCACDMDGLLSKLFYYSKLETGNMPFYKQQTDVQGYLRHYAEGRKDLAAQKAVLRFQSICEENCFLDIDQEQMKRVFDNFVENSLKYAHAEPLIMGITLEKEQDDSLTIIFSDNGGGVPPAKLPHLFEQFYRGDEARSDGEGSGLGLYVCQYIVREHGGTIRAENRGGLHLIMNFRK